MRSLVADAGLEGEIEVESAGTGDWHVGHPPDERALSAAAARGITLEGVARQVTAADFEAFDLIVAMDRANRDDLLAIAPHAEARDRVRLLREYAGESDRDVPDPYYGGEDGFAEVVEIVERSCAALIDELGDGRV